MIWKICNNPLQVESGCPLYGLCAPQVSMVLTLTFTFWCLCTHAQNASLVYYTFLAPLDIWVCNPYSEAITERTSSDDIFSNRGMDLKILSLENFTCSRLRNFLENNTIKGHKDDQSPPPTSLLADSWYSHLRLGLYIFIVLLFLIIITSWFVFNWCPING